VKTEDYSLQYKPISLWRNRKARVTLQFLVTSTNFLIYQSRTTASSKHC